METALTEDPQTRVEQLAHGLAALRAQFTRLGGRAGRRIGAAPGS
jgi:hypothetical protein